MAEVSIIDSKMEQKNTRNLICTHVDNEMYGQEPEGKNCNRCVYDKYVGMKKIRKCAFCKRLQGHDDDMSDNFQPIKPPLGIKPSWLQAEERIKELAGAIERYSKHCENEENLKHIRAWAEEIQSQCDIIEFIDRV